MDQPQFTPRNYAGLADEGFCQQIVAYFCVGLIANGFGALEWSAYKGEREVADHPVTALWRRPNPLQGGSRFRRALMASYLIAGNAYVEGVPVGGPADPRRPRPPVELWSHRPDRVQVVPGPVGIPKAYRYRTAGGWKDFPVDQLSGHGYLCHSKDFHPLNDWYGLAPAEVAARWIDLHNAGAAANAALLMNGGNPSALFSYKPEPGKSSLTPEQLDQVKMRLQQIYSGTSNWGEPLVLGGEWAVQRISATLNDMQWTAGMHEAARAMCLAWGVPFVLVVPGESTYSNREQADLELWDHAILPRIDILLEDLNVWFQWLYQDEELEVRYDRDRIAALEPRRKLKRDSVRNDYALGLISLEEARVEIDYGKAKPADHFAVGPLAEPATPGGGQQPLQPAQGQQTLKPAGSGPGGGPPSAAQPTQPTGGRPPLVALPGGRRDDGETEAKAEQPRHPQGIVEGGRWRPRGPDDPPTEEEMAQAEGLAVAVLDDAPLASELAPALRAAVAHFAQRALDHAKAGDTVSEVGRKARFDGTVQQVGEFADRVVDRARLIGDTSRTALGLAFGRALRAGTDLITALRTTFDGFAPRVATIATTETTRAAGYGSQLGMQAAGTMLKQWLCVSGDTRVAALGVTHVARRPYRGRLVTLRSASGGVVTVTADHPVLTSRGWLPARDVDEGDDLIRHMPVVEGTSPRSAVVPHVQDVPPPIEQVFAALHELATERGVMGGVVDLHRHGADGEIEVVTVRGDLLAHLEPALPEGVREKLLELTDAGLAHLFQGGELPADRRRARHAAPGGREPFAGRSSPRLFLGTPGPDDAGGAGIPDRDAVPSKDPRDHLLRAPEASGDGREAEAGQVPGHDLLPLPVDVRPLVPADGPATAQPAIDLGLGLESAGPADADLLRLPEPADGHAGLGDDRPDLAVRAAVPARDHQGRRSCHVLFDYDRCVSVDVGAPTECHVYDYSTGNGWMIADGLVVHNSRKDDVVRDAHAELDGQVVPVDAPFRYRDKQALFPGGFGEASLDVGCRCVAVPVPRLQDAKSKEWKAARDELARALDAELREFEARVAEAVRQGFQAQERRAMVRLAERDRGAA